LNRGLQNSAEMAFSGRQKTENYYGGLNSMVIDFIVERLLPDCLITLVESHFQIAKQWLI